MNLFLSDIAAGHKLVHKSMVATLAPYLSQTAKVTHARTTRIEKEGRQHLWGSPDEAIQFAKGWVEENTRSGHVAVMEVAGQKAMNAMMLAKVQDDYVREQAERQKADKKHKAEKFDGDAWWSANVSKLRKQLPVDP